MRIKILRLQTEHWVNGTTQTQMQAQTKEDTKTAHQSISLRRSGSNLSITSRFGYARFPSGPYGSQESNWRHTKNKILPFVWTSCLLAHMSGCYVVLSNLAVPAESDCTVPPGAGNRSARPITLQVRCFKHSRRSTWKFKSASKHPTSTAFSVAFYL